MANVIKIKRSTVPGKIPLSTDLEIGELALNTADGVLYTKHSDETIKQIGGAAGNYSFGSTAPVSPDLGDLWYDPSENVLYIYIDDGTSTYWLDISSATAGPTGDTGFVGSQGIQGDTGFVGSQGIQGDVGFTGSQGIQGDTGFVGSQGIQGDVGFTGSQGIQGDTGFVGSQGDTGLGFRIAKSYVSVAALEADTSPTGIIAGEFAIVETGDVDDLENSRLYLWTGTQYTYVTDLSGQQGITGPQGDTGFTGSRGVDGTIGVDGYTGSQGVQGDVGFTGSQGIQGDVGFTGSQGIQGDQGVIGYTGSQGDQGIQGDVGFTGSQGIQGDTGFVGSQGDTGFVGSQGIQGETGFVGSQGDIGYVGSEGYTGSQGESTFTWGNTSPVSPTVGDRWYNTTESILLVYVDDGDSQQWVEVAASGFLGPQGYTGSAGNITANIDQSTAGSVLISDGTSASWASGAFMFRNRVINGDMRIDQRNVGSVVTTNNSTLFPVDRWFLQNGVATNMTAQQSTVVPNSTFSHSVVITAPTAINTTAAQQILFQHRIEGYHCADFAWGTPDAQPATLSFWVRSSITGSYAGVVNNGTAGFVFTYEIDNADTWQYVIINLPATEDYAFANTQDGVGIYLALDLGSGTNFETASPGTWGTGDFKRTSSTVKWANNSGATFYVTGVQLELGTVATRFERRLLATELDLCRRYYQKSYNLNQKPGTVTGQFTGGTLTYTQVAAGYHQLSTVRFVPTMRGNPGITIYNPTTGATSSLWAQVAGNVPGYISMSNSGSFNIGVNNTTVSSGQGIFGHWAASAEI